MVGITGARGMGLQKKIKNQNLKLKTIDQRIQGRLISIWLWAFRALGVIPAGKIKSEPLKKYFISKRALTYICNQI